MNDDAPDVQFSGIDTDATPITRSAEPRLVTIDSVTASNDDDAVIDGDITEQAHRAFANVDNRLDQAGVTRDDLTKLTYYVADQTGLPAVAAIRDEYVGTRDIEVTYAAVSSLARRGALIEIDAFAVSKGKTR